MIRRASPKTGKRAGTFTRATWDKLLARLNGTDPHPHARHLREGIEEFRNTLRVREESA